MSLVQTDEFANLAVQVALLALQYWSELHALFAAVSHAPAPLHTDDMTPVQSVAHVSAHDTSDTG
jgi:hypothetical protein